MTRGGQNPLSDAHLEYFWDLGCGSLSLSVTGVCRSRRVFFGQLSRALHRGPEGQPEAVQEGKGREVVINTNGTCLMHASRGQPQARGQDQAMCDTFDDFFWSCEMFVKLQRMAVLQLQPRLLELPTLLECKSSFY